MTDSMEDSVLSLGVRDEDEGLDDASPSSYSHYPANPRRTITFLITPTYFSGEPCETFHCDSNLHAGMPALAAISMRLCTEPDNLPPGTGILTYPGDHGQIASVSGLHDSIIEDRSPLLAASFESSSSGRRLHLETLSSRTVMPFLRFLYTGSYAASGDWEDVPTSVWLHCTMYWLGHLYDLPDLKSQAYVNVLRQFEFGCSSPEKPIDLCKAIDFAYKTLACHVRISDAIVQYCVTRCLSHKLHEDAEFRGLAFSVRAFHQDLTRVCRDRGYEDEASAAIIQLPYKHFAPDTYASREDPPIASFHDVVHHFHSTDRFDDDSSPKKKQRVTLRERRASSPMEIPRLPGTSNQPSRVAQGTESAEKTLPLNEVALPIRQRDTGSQATNFAPSEEETSLKSNAALPIRQLDDVLEKLSTAPPGPGFFKGRGFAAKDWAKPARVAGSGEDSIPGVRESGYAWRNETPRYCKPIGEYIENMRKTQAESKQESEETTGPSYFNSSKQQQSHAEAMADVTNPYRQFSKNPDPTETVEPQERDRGTEKGERRNRYQKLDTEPAKYNYQRIPLWKPRTLGRDSASSTKDLTAGGTSSGTQQKAVETDLKRKPLNVAEKSLHPEEVKRREVKGRSRRNTYSDNHWQPSAYASVQARRQAQTKTRQPPVYPNWGDMYKQAYGDHVNYPQGANTAETAHFTPSNVSPTLPPTVFGTLPSGLAPPLENPRQLYEYPPTLTPLTQQNLANSQSKIESAHMQVSDRKNPVVAHAASAATVAPIHVDPEINALLQDYQLQLDLLEKQNKKRCNLMGRRSLDVYSKAQDTAPASNASTKTVAGTISVNEQISDVGTTAAENGSDVLDGFDMDAFLAAGYEDSDFDFPCPGSDMSVLQHNFVLQKQLQESAEREMRLLREMEEDHEIVSAMPDSSVENRHSDTLGNSGHESSVRDGESPRAAEETAMDHLNAASPTHESQLPLTQAEKEPGTPMPVDTSPNDTSANPNTPPTPTPALNRTPSASDVDMCGSDSDSDMSWIDVAIGASKPANNPEQSTVTEAAPKTPKKPSSTNAKRSSTSSESEWDFC